MTPRALAVVAIALTLGCATRSDKGPASAVETAPNWTTPDGRHATQLELAERLIELDQPREALTLLATVRTEAGKPELAVDVLSARATLELGMTGEAAAILEPWLERAPRDPDFHALLGLVRFDQKQLEPAEQALRRAIQLDAGHFEAHNNLGFLLLSDGRPELAIEQLRAALTIRPSDVRARNNLGFALAAAGQPDQALEVFRAVNSEPAALANMGLAAERSGDADAALAWYRQALALDPEHSAAALAVGRLQPSSQGDPP
jgi:Tfp pilus assembly protein PilF